jgi:micrococcal nuclease
MSDKPSAAWYLAPIFLGIIGAAIMWFVLKDEDHPDSPKMVKKGWIIGIVLTLISVAWIPIVMIPVMFMGGFDQQNMMQPISEHVEQMKTETIPEHFERMITEPVQQQVPAPGFKDVPEMIVESSNNCSGSARCFTGDVTQIIDGDTIMVDGESIRFALTSTPELNEFGGPEARNFIASICPVGSQALVDEDDGQTQGSYGRIIGVIYCNGMNLNEEILDADLGILSSGFCSSSEFSTHEWAKRYGCAYEEPPKTTTPSTQTQQPSCDPSYPDFCIPSPPPDLDCKDIPQKRFTVLQPDPHRFDGDKDGIGCES